MQSLKAQWNRMPWQTRVVWCTFSFLIYFREVGEKIKKVFPLFPFTLCHHIVLTLFLDLSNGLCFGASRFQRSAPCPAVHQLCLRASGYSLHAFCVMWADCSKVAHLQLPSSLSAPNAAKLLWLHRFISLSLLFFSLSKGRILKAHPQL